MRSFGRLRRRNRSHGQALVEFSLILLPFLTIVVGIFEFSFFFTASLSTSFASRDAVQIAAELANSPGADCVILRQVERDVTPPVNVTRIQSVEIFWANADGTAHAASTNSYSRGGTFRCDYPDGTFIIVPYSRGLSGYTEDKRCSVVSGAGCAAGHSGLDTIAVKVTYQYAWITPLPGIVGLLGSGPLITQTNYMRIEPQQ